MAALVDKELNPAKVRRASIKLLGGSPLMSSMLVPTTSDEIKAWLEMEGLGHLCDSFAREGFTTSKKFTRLTTMDIKEIKDALGINGSDATDLLDALATHDWR